jgi:hypothetical protein
MKYTVNKVFAEGLVGINGGMWSRCKVRKPHDCDNCRRPIKKNERAFRPLNEHSELRPRMARVCERCVDHGKQQLERASTGSEVQP